MRALRGNCWPALTGRAHSTVSIFRQRLAHSRPHGCGSMSRKGSCCLGFIARSMKLVWPFPHFRLSLTCRPQGGCMATRLNHRHGAPVRWLSITASRRHSSTGAAVPVLLPILRPEAVRRKTSRGRLAVWALRADFLDQQRHHRTDLGHLELFVAPRATNPNLHAQSGIFTILRGSERPVPVDTYLENFLACHAERLQKSGWPAMPLMRCLSVPAAYAPELLRRLSYEGVTGATMFPGHDGVVRALREQAQWDTPPTQSAK